MSVPPLNAESKSPIIPLGLLTTSRFCWANCPFCRLAAPVSRTSSLRVPTGLTWENIERAGATWNAVEWVKLRGGLSSPQPFDYWIHLIRRIRSHFTGRLLAFSPVEIWHYHHVERRSVRELVRLLRWAGADVLGPGGSETFKDRPTHPGRLESDQWLMVVNAAAAVGLGVSAAPMVAGDMTMSDWADYVGFLKACPLTHLEVKPFRAQGTAWAARGDTPPLDTIRAIEAIRALRPNLPIYLDWDSADPDDAAHIFGAVGLTGVLVPYWWVNP